MKYTKIAKEIMNNTEAYEIVSEAYDRGAELTTIELTKIAKIANNIETIENIEQVRKIADKMFKEVDKMENEEYKASYEVVESNIEGVYDVFEDGEFVESVTEKEAKEYK